MIFYLLFSDLMLLLAMIAFIFSFTNGAPQMRRHRRHHVDYNHPRNPLNPNNLAWKNSCGGEFFEVSRVVSIHF